MDIIKFYGNIITRNIHNPKSARNLIKLGLSLEALRTKHFSDKKLPLSLQYLSNLCVKYILEALNSHSNYGFVNLFSPSEILHALNVPPLFVEGFSSFLCGLQCEDVFIDASENSGISETLCSYHKAFIGSIETGVLPKPKFAITSSTLCDANINTFRYASSKYQIPLYIIDIPYSYNKDSELYVVEQLKELIDMLENTLHKKLDYNNLRQILLNENQSKCLFKKYLKESKYKYFPSSLTIEMYKLFASHVSIGRPETLRFYELLAKDIKNSKASKATGKRFLWIHTLPFYNKHLTKYFNFNEDYQLLSCDLNFDYMENLDLDHPLNALAKKMILNNFNGSYERKIEEILKLYKETNADAVINFCQWGCKQSNSGVSMLNKELSRRNIPFISIDGDGIDRRKSSCGQVKTRVEAFLEILNKQY
ncbi:2-hydroxyacyl-CoA dehydratase subunit D [Haloimpatiens sp. FM7315]|uniref:2-hydroxyacyl-CoA dehydratase subunit D n=1 Tax=Haloimpatiens sp. FM7315 TaxID=3298609 RepID=UPI0039773AC3